MHNDFTTSAARICEWLQTLNDRQLDELEAILDDAPPLEDVGPLLGAAFLMREAA